MSGTEKVVNNREFAEKNKEFREACEREGVEPTTRQASKFRNRIKRWANYKGKNE
jgi:predicted HicB family RNase H-like nuclease